MKLGLIARNALLVGGLLVIVGLIVVQRVLAGGGSARHDAQHVFCLSPNQRLPLVSAAISLGLAGPGGSASQLTVRNRQLTVDEWRHAHPQAFERSCAALVASAQLPSAGTSSDPGVVLSLATNLAAVFAGALLTWLSGEWRAAAERNRLQAETLTNSMQAFAEAADDYIRGWADPESSAIPRDDMLRARRADLSAQLRLVEATHPRWTVLASLRSEIQHGELGDDLAITLHRGRQGGTNGSAVTSFDDLVTQLRTSLRKVVDDTGLVVGTLLRASAWRRGDLSGQIRNGDPHA